MKTDFHSPRFVGREHELRLLSEAYQRLGASFVVLYGRRRVGKTRLITEFYKDKGLWRFDGVEHGKKKDQIKSVLGQLSRYTGEALYRDVHPEKWMDVVEALDGAIEKSRGKYRKTIFFDEFSYLSAGQEELVSALKWIWDNRWQDKEGFTLVLCGSVASFMVQRVVRSSSLYGRVQLEICLKPLSVPEVVDFFRGKKSIREVCEGYLFCGGIPEYLLQMNPKQSIRQNMARLALSKDGYFVFEFDRLFKDIFREENVYKQIISCLSRYKSLKVPELAHLLGRSAGGGLDHCLENLELAGFIKAVVPWDRPPESRLRRFRLDDEYVLFYFKFIEPNSDRIQETTSAEAALRILNEKSYEIWKGFAFERLVLKHAQAVMKCLQIDQLVKNYGPYFNRASNRRQGVQIDLLFVRYDPVVTVCEIKYHSGLIGKWVMEEVEQKVALLDERKKTVEKVLITTEGVTRDLADSGYFSRIILLDELFHAG